MNKLLEIQQKHKEERVIFYKIKNLDEEKRAIRKKIPATVFAKRKKGFSLKKNNNRWKKQKKK